MQWPIYFMSTKQRFYVVLILILGLTAVKVQARQAAGEIWKELAPGLLYAAFPQEQTEESESKQISVLQIDPAHYRFQLLSATEQGDQRRTIKGWIYEFDLVAGINAGMFWKDLRTSTGFMKNFEHLNNSILHPDYGAFFVFNPIAPGLEPVQLLDRELHPDWKTCMQRYQTVVQNYRMISAERENVWVQSTQKYSVAAIGMDLEGHVLFIFSQKPRTIHDLNTILLELPINIRNCMFVEGGPVASMYVKTETLEQEWAGLHKNTFWSEMPGTLAQIPNVIGIVKKE